MPFGSRRFTQLVFGVETHNGREVGVYRARFVPLNFGEQDELVTEEELTLAFDDNARLAVPLPDAEEKLALAAFRAQARNRAHSRAAVEAVALRGAQLSTVDPLTPAERVVVERFRTCVTRAKLPPRGGSQSGPDPIATSKQAFVDACKDTLALLEKYFPKPRLP
jgi:hypothetical protein